MVRFKVRLPHSISYVQNRWLLIDFIPTAPSTNTNPRPGTGSEATNELNCKHIYALLKQSVLAHFGETGWGAVGLSLTVKYYSPTTHLCMFRVARNQHRIAWGAVTLLASMEVDGKKCIPNVVHVSGTIKHTQLASIQHNREVIARYRALSKTPAAYQDSYDEFLQTSTTEIEALQD